MSNYPYAVVLGDEPEVTVALATGKKCMRCWKIKDEVGFCGEIDDVCLRCYKVLEPGQDDFELYSKRFDHLYRTYRERGISKEEAVDSACRQNRNE
jgi:hypothetical protein